MSSRLVWLFAVVIAAAGCNETYDNPFQFLQGTAPPPAGADLLVTQSPDATTAVREVFAIDADGSGAPTRLTGCAARRPICDILEVAPSPDRQRVAVRRRSDANFDGKVDPSEPETTFVMDLLRGIEGPILADFKGVNSLSWTTVDVPLFFSATGEGGLDDLFQSAADGTNPFNLSVSADARERHPRVVGGILTFEDTRPGRRSEVWGFVPSLGAAALSTGDPAIEPLPLAGTDYLLGSDADPEPSPDATLVVFRRLTGAGEAGRGTWDIVTVPIGSSELTTIASGGAFRGAPTWGLRGIVFVEIPVGATTASLVQIDPSSGDRKVLLAGAPLNLQSPRWLP